MCTRDRDPMLIEIEFRDGKRVNVLSMPAKDGIKYFSLMEKKGWYKEIYSGPVS